MKKSLFLIGLLCAGMMSASATSVTYTPDDTTRFKNPERGFTDEVSAKVSESKPNVVKGNVSTSIYNKYYMTTWVVLYNLYNYKAAELPDKVLAGFDEDMQALRENGWKCVLRFAYTESQSDKVDATPDWVDKHLAQLSPHLKKNADVIYAIEAGFVGAWGEWYYTKNYGNESQHMNDNRRQVIESLFRYAPTDRFILFRYPMIKAEFLNDYTPLTAEEAFSGTVKARMGCHNDAFLNNWGNDGTYVSWNEEKSDDPAVRDYIAAETLYVPNGGETNVEDKSTANKVYAKAPEEMSKYHWSFCGRTYATQVTNQWRSSGIFDTLNVHMGYRYNLLNAQYSDKAAPAGKMNVSIRVRNNGYAPIYNERTVYIVLKKGSSVYRLPLQSDPRRWLPNNVVSVINEQVEIPADVAEGTYKLYLWMPDQYESIKNDPRYAVRFANTNVWDDETGYNDLKATITIDKNAPKDPGDLPDIEAIPSVANSRCAAHKVLENGVLYIIAPNGRRYSVDGMMK